MSANADKPDIFQPGERFRGYVIERLLGKGGLGAVYMVRHEMLDTFFAMKVLYPSVVTKSADYVWRFLREARLATRIRHPNLVAVHDCGRDDSRGLYYLVMDYVAGSDLRNAIAFSGTFEPAHAVRVVVQVAEALAAAQKFKVVHRDIKPENIMLQPDGSVKLVDLGIAKACDVGSDSQHTTTESVFGTPAYISPEQAMNASDVDVRADIYSLGIVFFEMLAGRAPYAGTNTAQIIAQVISEEPTPDVRDFNPEVPVNVAVLIRRMCVKERDRRLSSYDVLLSELAKLGYDLSGISAPKFEYTPSASTAEAKTSLKIDLNKLPEKNSTLSFETQDAEIQDFVSKLKQKRSKKRVTMAALAVAAVILILLLLLV